MNYMVDFALMCSSILTIFQLIFQDFVLKIFHSFVFPSNVQHQIINLCKSYVAKSTHHFIVKFISVFSQSILTCVRLLTIITLVISL